MTVMVPSTRPTAPVRDRLVAAIALTLSLMMKRWPLRWQIAVVRLLRNLPPARLARLEALNSAVLTVIPSWWPGRVACMEISLATVIATALTGRRACWVLGARFLPDSAHAWVEVPEGAVGRNIGDAADRPWLPVLSVPWTTALGHRRPGRPGSRRPGPHPHPNE
ncbi:lasso peptide biosynthesis B2 protein [Streptomyces sp. LE64]|uniref:lasso peptide biosynthesis B2 protein n=1 Tax=Streptomyces sp. LE64 TaxID=3448653 RepID=UPI004042A9D4